MTEQFVDNSSFGTKIGKDATVRPDPMDSRSVILTETGGGSDLVGKIQALRFVNRVMRRINSTNAFMPYELIEPEEIGYRRYREPMAIGACIETGSRRFFEINTEAKYVGCLNYLGLIAGINEDGNVLSDHKSDSVFLTEDGRLQIVDGGLAGDSRYAATSQQAAWQKEIVNGDLIKVLRCFFTAGNPNMSQRLIPDCIAQVISRVPEFKTAEAAFAEMAKISRSTKDLSVPISETERDQAIRQMRTHYKAIQSYDPYLITIDDFSDRERNQLQRLQEAGVWSDQGGQYLCQRDMDFAKTDIVALVVQKYPRLFGY